jgi:hypothetical protein
LLKQIDILVRKVRSNKQLSFKQKNESIEELGLIRKKIIDGFDLKDIEKGAQLAKSEAAIQVYKELDEIDARLRGKDYYNAEKSKALELKIDNLVQVGAKDKNYNFTNARVDVYPDKLKPNIFTLTLNKAQDKVFDAILVEVTKINPNSSIDSFFCLNESCLFDLTLRTKISICFSKYLYLPRPSRDCRTIRLSRFS